MAYASLSFAGLDTAAEQTFLYCLKKQKKEEKEKGKHKGSLDNF